MAPPVLRENWGTSYDVGGHVSDASLGGILVGGGTKPLHDLIQLVEKAKS